MQRGACLLVHQLIKTFLTGSHGEAMQSAAAMDLHSPKDSMKNHIKPLRPDMKSGRSGFVCDYARSMWNLSLS